MSDPSTTPVKACDTYPPPRGLAVRIGGRKLDGLKKHPGSNSPIIDDLHHPPSPTTDSANATASTSHKSTSSPSLSSISSSGSNFIGTVSEINLPNPVSAPRHLCVRHQRTADEGTNLILQEVCLSVSLQGIAPAGSTMHPSFLGACISPRVNKDSFFAVTECPTHSRASDDQHFVVHVLLLSTCESRHHPPGNPHHVL
jgi:hypothetical protein